MAVNNFAPAEYGGYVLGANSGGGGGGGLSEFDEFVGITSFANVTLNFVFPEGTTDTQIVDIQYKGGFADLDEYDNVNPHFVWEGKLTNPEGLSIIIPVPISENHDMSFLSLGDFSVNTGSGFYLLDGNNMTVSGDVESFTGFYLRVNGEGSATIGLSTD